MLIPWFHYYIKGVIRKLTSLLLRRLSVERKDTKVQKLCNILIIVLVWIVGGSLVAGCVTTSASKISDPSIMNQIKIGVTTKAEVRSLLGNPSDTIVTDNTNDSVTEHWSYSYQPSNGILSGVIRDNIMRTSARGIFGLTSRLPYSTLTGFSGQVVDTGQNLAYGAASNAAMEATHTDAHYHLSLSFVDGIVASKSYSGSGRDATKNIYGSRAGANRSTVIARSTKPQIPVYTTYNSRTYHKRNCTELGTNDLMQFSSSQKAREAGGRPCKHCNPS